MNKVILFLLGQKGYAIAKAATTPEFLSLIECVVIGEDRNIDNDHSDSIETLCKQENIRYHFKKDFDIGAYASNKLIAFAGGWRWLIREEFKSLVVFHDSLLPKYRGFNPLVTALLNRDNFIGVTAIIGNKDFDRGDIVSVKKIAVTYPIKISTAIELVSALYFDLALEIFQIFKTGRDIKGKPQDESEASYSLWRDEDDYRINWSSSADNIAHFINCLGSPYKGASTSIDGEIIRILEAEVLGDVKIENRDPGKVLFIDHGKPVVVCGSGLLKINGAINETGQLSIPFSKFRARLR